jgi:hypothetical protein
VKRALLALALALALTSCSRREPLVTWFDGAHAVSLRYPASWRSTPADPAPSGAIYRVFRPRDSRLHLTASLLAAPLEAGALDAYGAAFLAGKEVAFRRPGRDGAIEAAYADASGRYRLELVAVGPVAHGLLIQADEAAWKEKGGVIEDVAASFQPERPAAWGERREERFGYALRLPPSWRETQGFAKGDTLLRVFLSPAVGVDDHRQLLYASLTLTVESLGEGGFEGYYKRKREALGEAFPVVRHEPWKDGYTDTIVTETAVVTSRIKRFYRASPTRGYCLAFEASDDVYRRVAPWFDLIAGTLELS